MVRTCSCERVTSLTSPVKRDRDKTGDLEDQEGITVGVTLTRQQFSHSTISNTVILSICVVRVLPVVIVFLPLAPRRGYDSLVTTYL